MESITQKIDAIIALRQRNLEKVEGTKNNLNRIYANVQEFEKLKAKVLDDGSSYQQLFQGNQEVLARITSISMKDFYKAYEEYNTKLNQMIKRFSRKELHISFIGRAGQGKSLAMQNISGLNGNVIPSAEGSDCTGAKSVITNDNSAVKTSATIEFFSKREMIDIVNTYLEVIFHHKYSVGSIEDIKNLPVDEMDASLDFSQPEANARFRHLEKYVKHIEEFEDELGQTKTVDEADIERYVAQYKGDNPAKKYFHYLGVKMANIKCKFPKVDAGKIILVDTIGIGATSLGTEDKMLETVENDSDAIVFMFRPDGLRPRVSDNEVQIIKKVSDKVTPEYAKEMFFWILNRVSEGKAENANLMPELKNTINEGKYPVAKVLDVDCKNPEAVREQLLKPILEQLTARIDKVDNLLLVRLNKFGEALYKEYNKICTALDKILVGVANEDVKRALRNNIRDTTEKNVLNKLRDMYLQRYEQRSHPCMELEKAANEKLKEIFRSIPSKEQIVDMLNRGNVNQHNAAEMCTNIMRIHIIDAFEELDGVLDRLVREMKMAVLHILADDENGRLKAIVPLNDCPQEWIDCLMEKTECETKYPLLAKAFLCLREFRIKVQGFLIYEVRANLDPIDFSLQRTTPEIKESLTDKEMIAEDIIVWLKKYAEELNHNIKIALKKLNSVPNKAMFAALKDFYDRAAYAGEVSDLPVMTEWRYLYEDWLSTIWPEEYRSHFSSHEQAQEWEQAIKELKMSNKKQLFTVE